MSVEAITDTIHEYMYEKMNESRDTEEETNINTWTEKEATKNRKETNQINSEKSTALDAEDQTGTNNMIAQQKQKSA